MLEGLDVEAQGGRYLRDVLPVELLQNGRLPRIVQAYIIRSFFLALAVLGIRSTPPPPPPPPGQ